MPPLLSDPVVTAIRMFPDAVILPDHGCVSCTACQLITRTGVGVITVHHPDCPARARL